MYKLKLEIGRHANFIAYAVIAVLIPFFPPGWLTWGFAILMGIIAFNIGGLALAIIISVIGGIIGTVLGWKYFTAFPSI